MPASEDAGPRRGVDCDVPTLVGEPNKNTMGLEGGGLYVHVGWGGEQNKASQVCPKFALGNLI